MRLRRLIFGAIASVLAMAGMAHAQSDYPSHPVRIIVGFGAGAAADITARILAQHLSDTMGQRFIVENRPGGGSTIAAQFVASAPKDGYTLYLGTVANVINGALQPDLPLNFARDFIPVTLATSSPLVLVVHPSTGVTTVQGLIALAKSKPGTVFFGSSGIGTAPHLSGELFNMMAGVKMVHVPYQGSAQAISDLLAGRTQVMFAPVSTVLPHIKSGKLQASATTELKRSTELPDLPTIAEAGIPDFNTSLWLGIVAPSGTPSEVIDKLSSGMTEALHDPATADALSKLGFEIEASSPAQFATFIASETKKWDAVVKAAGLRK
jgi:tripartite-type tricarboxylate transporter receptor subunit TctC